MSIDQALVQQVADLYGLPSDLLTAQIQVESSGDPFAFRYEAEFFDRYIRANTSAKGKQYGPLAACSYGLLQVLLETALEEGFTDRPEALFMPRVGLTFGAKYLKGLYVWANQDYTRALAAYNGGRIGNTTPPFRNLDYARKVYAMAGRTV